MSFCDQMPLEDRDLDVFDSISILEYVVEMD